jgi:hypothetical protein
MGQYGIVMERGKCRFIKQRLRLGDRMFRHYSVRMAAGRDTAS